MGTSLRDRGAGLWDARTTRGWCRVFLVAVLITGMTHQAHAQPAEEDVSRSIEQLNALISETKTRSAQYILHGKLFPTDFGWPYIGWRWDRKFASHPYDHVFRRVIFLSVCNEDERALSALYETNTLMSGGLFDEFESEVLQWIVERRQLPLDFRGSFRENNPVFLDDDIKSIRSRHALQRALSENRKSEALKLVRSLRDLCGGSNQ